MPALMSFILRIVLLAAGLIFAASLALAFVALLVGWTLRSAWAKLAGRPVTPFVIRINPRNGFDRRTPRADSAQPMRPIPDVTDVEPKSPRS